MSHRARVWVALWTVYIIWGSTYLGIELAGETIPPLFAIGTRFVAAALLMFGFTAWRRGVRVFRVAPRELASCALVGTLLPCANALLFIAERHVPTGLASLIIGSVPLWVVLLRTSTRDRPPLASLAGVLVGGLILLPLGLATTQPHFGDFSGRSIGGWLYLVSFGSIIGYTAYVWLLENAPIGKVATYAYVNPVVAIALGAIVLHEALTWTIGLGAVLVLACVAVVVRRESMPPEAEEIGAGV